MVPAHEAFLASLLDSFTQGDHIIHHVLVVGDDTGLKALNGKWEGVGDHEAPALVLVEMHTHVNNMLMVESWGGGRGGG